MIRKQLGAIAVAAGLVFSSTSFAHDEKKTHTHAKVAAEVSVEAKAEAEKGDTAFEQGQLRSALEAYGAAYAKSQDEALLVAMARVHTALKQKSEAKQLFTAYLKSGSSELAHRAEAEASAGKVKTETKAEAKAEAKAEKTKGVGGALGGAVGGVVTGTKDAVGSTLKASTGLLSAVKVDVSGEVGANAQAKAEEGDQAFEGGNYEAASTAYAEAYAQDPDADLLFARGMAEARAKDAAEARALLQGYLTAQPKGSHAAEARASLLALGGTGASLPKLNLKAKAAAAVKTDVGQADAAYKVGNYVEAARLYGESHAKASTEAALLYGQGLSLYAAGHLEKSRAALKAYLASQGKLEFKAQAEATLASSN